jgi:hypothetical protein
MIQCFYQPRSEAAYDAIRINNTEKDIDLDDVATLDDIEIRKCPTSQVEVVAGEINKIGSLHWFKKGLMKKWQGECPTCRAPQDGGKFRHYQNINKVFKGQSSQINVAGFGALTQDMVNRDREHTFFVRPINFELKPKLKGIVNKTYFKVGFTLVNSLHWIAFGVLKVLEKTIKKVCEQAAFIFLGCTLYSMAISAINPLTGIVLISATAIIKAYALKAKSYIENHPITPPAVTPIKIWKGIPHFIVNDD